MEPYFFQENLPSGTELFTLDEAASKHCVQVLRMAPGARIRLTNGRGLLAVSEIKMANRKHCTVRILETYQTSENQSSGFSIGIALTKNKSRNEWLLEKLTEIGVVQIFPLITEHSEKEKFNKDRYEKILIAALLQSQQTWLPKLHSVQKLSSFLKDVDMIFSGQKFIAHCFPESDQRKTSFLSHLQKDRNCLILIGPEGDFSKEEVTECLRSGFIPVHLGKNRLRTETAGIYACTVYNAFQDASN